MNSSRSVQTVTAKEDSKQMHDLVKGTLERAWYGAPGHEWTRNQGVEVTFDVRSLLETRANIKSYTDEFGDPAPGFKKVLVVEYSNNKLQLRDWFTKKYVTGSPFTLLGFRTIGSESCYLHKATDIKVWQDALDLRDGSPDFVVVFHYTDYIGFMNITAPAKAAAEIFASLHTHDTEDGQSANAWYGKGAYGTAKGPDDFDAEYTANKIFLQSHNLKSACEYIVDNNFRKMAQRDGFEQYVPKVKYCIPLIVARQNAYDVNVQQTPEMAQQNCAPGYNLRGAQMNVPGMPTRDQWVVRVAQEGTVQNARAALTGILRARADRGDTTSLTRLADVLDARGQKEEAKDLYRQCYEASKILYHSDHPQMLIHQNNYAYALTQLKRYAEAEPIQKDIYERHKKKYSENARNTILCLRNWAFTIKNLGQPEVAEPKFKEAYERSKKAFGEGDTDTMEAMGAWAYCLKQLGQVDQALNLRKQVYEESKKSLGKNHPYALTEMSNYGIALREVGRNEEAEPLLRAVYDARNDALGPNHPMTQRALERLGKQPNF